MLVVGGDASSRWSDSMGARGRTNTSTPGSGPGSKARSNVVLAGSISNSTAMTLATHWPGVRRSGDARVKCLGVARADVADLARTARVGLRARHASSRRSTAGAVMSSETSSSSTSAKTGGDTTVSILAVTESPAAIGGVVRAGSLGTRDARARQALGREATTGTVVVASADDGRLVNVRIPAKGGDALGRVTARVSR